MPQSSNDPVLREAMYVYFAAKARLFSSVPAFRLLSVGPLICFHRHPGWSEVDGFYTVDGETPPPEVLATIRAYGPDPEHMITVFTDSPESVVPSYEALGYQPLPDPQPFMSKSLAVLPAGQPAGNAAVSVSRVETPAQMDFLNADEEIMEPAYLNDGRFRYYYVACDNKPVCWGRCVRVSPEAVYIAGMETAPKYRRRGLATALMNRMHADAADSGAGRSILCSTAMGFGFYKKVGYTQLAHMQAFVPQVTSLA